MSIAALDGIEQDADLPHSVPCTAVVGVLNYSMSVVKTRSIPARGVLANMVSKPSDFGGVDNFGTREFSASFRLVPGVGINHLSTVWYQYIGA